MKVYLGTDNMRKAHIRKCSASET